MENKNITDKKQVYSQYKNPDQLVTRISLHEKYSTNPQGISNWLFDIYDFKNANRLLELGSGTGDLWKNRDAIFNKLQELVLSDFSDGMVQEISNSFINNPNIKTKKIDIMNIPFEASSFDIVIANFMLYHIDNVHHALMEIFRVLKPGGIFYCATVGENHLMEINKWLKEYMPQSDIFNSSLLKFNLQNGRKQLADIFSDIQLHEYNDNLNISCFDDFINYIFSLKDFMNLDESGKKDLEVFLKTKIDNNGMIKISKQAGTFVATKLQ